MNSEEITVEVPAKGVDVTPESIEKKVARACKGLSIAAKLYLKYNGPAQFVAIPKSTPLNRCAYEQGGAYRSTGLKVHKPAMTPRYAFCMVCNKPYIDARRSRVKRAKKGRVDWCQCKATIRRAS